MPGPEEARRVRVFVADDHPLLREGLTRAIKSKPELELVGRASNGREALAAIRELEPDVALLDVRMPGLGGMEVAHALSRDGAPTRVVFLSGYVDSGIAYRALAEGVAGVISKEAGGDAVCDAIAAVARGEVVLSPDVQGSLAEAIRGRGQPEGPALTPRERDVLVLISEGYSAPEIGERLFLSTATVKGHLRNIYEKLGVSDRAAAVAEAMRHGLLE